MKKVLMSLAAVAAVFAGCQKPELEVAPVEVKEAFTATVENFGATKTAMDGNHVVWSTGDQLAIFQGTGVADLYELADGYEGLASGKFTLKAGMGDDFYGGMEMTDPRNVAFYPYAQGLATYCEEGAWVVSNVTLPATQAYTENSFANGAFPMVAVTESLEDHVLRFKNVLGAVKLQFTGKSAIKSVALKGNNNEVLAGAATVAAHDGFETPSVVVAENGATEVVLECGEGVQLSETEATAFVLAVAPVNFENGFTVTVTYVGGYTHTIEAAAANEVLRSGVLVMPEVALPTPPSLDFTYEAGMTDVALSVKVEGYTGFYGIFSRPDMWDMVQEYVGQGWVSFGDILSGMMGTELPCLLYEGPEFTGNLSTFGISEEYLEWGMDNMLAPGNSYVVALVPVVEGKVDYALEDAIVYNVATADLVMGGNVALPEYTIEKGYNTSSVFLAGSDEVVYVKYDIYEADAEVPTEETCLEEMAWAYDGYYDPTEGAELMVDNSYGVLPGAAYKVAIIVAKADGSASLHVLDVETLSIPYNENLVVTFDGAPEYDSANNTALTLVNVPAGAVKLYYTLNKQATYTDYNAASALVGILEGTTGFASVDLTEEGAVEDGQVVIEPSVGSLNNYADATVAVHVAVVDAEGKVSQFTSSATCVAAKKQ